MLFEVTDELVNAIFQNEGRKAAREPKHLASGNKATLKPDWCQLPPGARTVPGLGPTAHEQRSF